MTVRRRSFAGPADVVAIQAFQTFSIAAGGHLGFMHPGDAPHRLYNEARNGALGDVVTIWEDQSGIVAWLLVYRRWSGFDLQVHPEARARHPEIEREAIDLAEEALAAHDAEAIETDVHRGDAERVAVIAGRGWASRGETSTVNRRSLDDVPAPALPEGFAVRAVCGLDEVAEVAEVHRRSFGSTWTAEEYAEVMRFPGYDVERELVAVAPDGRLAGFTVTWHDRVNGIGLFEPVGTHEEFRRLGIARLLMSEGMRRMRRAGLRWAIVANEVDNPASRGLYAAMGFEPWLHVETWRKSG